MGLHNAAEWRGLIADALAVPGYEGRYAITAQGTIFSLRGPHGVRRIAPRKERSTNRGYVVVRLYDGTRHRSELVHRLVARAFIGPADRLQVNHKNGIKTDNSVDNLEYVTCSENHRHAFRVLGRLPSMSHWTRKPFAKLNPTIASEIRASYAHGEASQRELARKYGVSRGAVQRLLRGDSWKEA